MRPGMHVHATSNMPGEESKWCACFVLRSAYGRIDVRTGGPRQGTALQLCHACRISDIAVCGSTLTL